MLNQVQRGAKETVTYGNLHNQTVTAHCGQCSRYLNAELTRVDERGVTRCRVCNRQVRIKPLPSRLNAKTRRRLQGK